MEVVLAVILGAIALVIAYFFLWKPSPSSSNAPPVQAWKPVSATPPPKAEAKKTAAAAEPETPSANSIKFVYGSQTGTAEEFAKTLASEAKGRGFAPKVVDLEEWGKDPEAAVRREIGGMVVFVVATYGDGEPTDNAKDFYDWLVSDEQTGASEGKEPFKGMRFSVFGLGNKTYQHYNAIGKTIFKRVKELGGEVLFEMGLGDDDGTLEEDFNKWKASFWSALAELNGQVDQTQEDSGTHVRRLKAYYSDPTHAGQLRSSSGSVLAPSTPAQKKIGYDPKSPKDCVVVVNRELHGPTSDRSCRHIEIDLGDLTYEAGDHLGIFPQNNTQLVEDLAKKLGLNVEGGDLNRIIKLVQVEQEDKTELGPCSIRQALFSLSDISSIPRKTVLKILSYYATNPEERKRLELLASNDSEQPQDFNYNKFIKDDCRSIAELIIHDFPSIKIPLDAFLEIVPRLQPRFYSISSSPLEHGNCVHVTAVVTEFVKPTGRKHSGVCTTWLKARQVGEYVPVFVRRSNFKLPSEVSSPILMIGPGTGLAPFRGFIYERKHQAKIARQQNKATGANLLFFGCRHPDVDYIYRDELEAESGQNHIDLHLAFSRQDPNRKVYVQHLLRQKKSEIFRLLDQGGLHIYVCGEAKAMARDVNKALAELVAEEKGISEKEAEDYLNSLSQCGRYQQDVW